MEIKTTIYTDESGRVFSYQNEANTLVMHEVAELPEIPAKSLCDGYHIYIDSVFSFGYEINDNKCYKAINDLKAKLKATDYIAHKKTDGEDTSIYSGYEELRISQRIEINKIESLINSNQG